MSEATVDQPKPAIRRRRSGRRTPSVLQLEAAECGAASLAMVLGRFGRHVPLETLRDACGVSRDGSKASNILKAARLYGLNAKGVKAEPELLRRLPLPAIVFVDFCHFLVVDRVTRRFVYLVDPASGRRRIDWPEFDAMFTGVALTFEPTKDFKRSNERPSVSEALWRRTRGLRGEIALLILISLALVLPGLIMPILSRVFVDYVLVRSLDDWLAPLLIGIGMTAVVRFALVELNQRHLAQAETRLAVDGASELLRRILRLPTAYFGTRFAGEIAGRLGLSDGLAALLTGDIALTVLNLFTAFFFLALMLAYNVEATLVIVAFSLANAAVVIASGRAVSEAHRKLSIDGGKLHGVAMSGLRDIETYKAAGAEDSLFRRWVGLNSQVVSLSQHVGRRLTLVSAAPTVISSATSTTVLILGGFAVMRGDMTIGSLVALQSLAASFVGPILALTNQASAFQQVRSMTERIDDVLQQPLDPAFASPPRIEGRLPQGFLQLEETTFGYLPLEPPLIKGLSLSARPGGRIALVGASGSGKSTVGRLIVGLYQPSGGRVLIDGEPLTAWPRAALSSRLAYIDQEIVLFEGSIRDNLTLWDPTISEAQLTRAAKDAEIHDVIAARPGAYESRVEEGGGNFSGGQRQRLEIARALATDPKVLVLDEATSALDPIVEARIMDNVRARGATLILIAHRLSTIRDSDEIILMERGVVVERGTHDMLMANRGRYAELIEA